MRRLRGVRRSITCRLLSSTRVVTTCKSAYSFDELSYFLKDVFHTPRGTDAAVTHERKQTLERCVMFFVAGQVAS